MEYIVAALFFASVWHFTYQAILLPSIHMKQRNRLFALRDKLRTFHFEESSQVYKRAFEVAESGLNNAINSVELLDLEMQLRIHRLHATSPEYRKRVAARTEALKSSDCEEINNIVQEANGVLRDIFFYNTGGWMVYIIPPALCFMFYAKIVETAKEIFAAESRDVQAVFNRRGQHVAMAA